MHQQSSEGISFMCLILLLHPACLPPSLPAGSSRHVCAITRWKRKRIYAFSKTLDKVRGPWTQKRKKRDFDKQGTKCFFDLYTVAMVAFTPHNVILSPLFIIYSYVCTDTQSSKVQRRSHTKIWPDHWHPQICSFALETVSSPKTN